MNEIIDRPRSLTKASECSESDAEYLDASESVIYGQSLLLLDTIDETTITMNLFLNNKFDLAEERMAELCDRSMYHALGYTSIVFIKAMMTCDKQEMEKAMVASKNACTVMERYRQKLSITESLSVFGGKQRQLTDDELHAELCYAESLLIRAILSFFHDENLASFVRGAFKIRTCYQTYRYCQKLLESEATWVGRPQRVKDEFESGVRMGVGMFNLLLSIMPSKVLRLLEVVGFSGNKGVGMFELHQSAAIKNTLRSPLCAMVLCMWHLIVCFLVGCGKPDIALCDRLLPPLTKKYPKGAITLYLRARLVLVSGDVDSAIYYFNKSIEAQNIYKQFHHGCYWELLFCHSYLLQWAKAANYAKRLVSESKWSRCVYTYMLSIFFAADETVDPKKRDETVMALARKVDGLRLRIAGKSIPVEKFCGRKAKRFVATGSFAYAHYEFMYFWNGFDIIGCNDKILDPILEDLDRIWERIRTTADVNDECLYYFLRAICLKSMNSPYQAEQCLHKVLQFESQLTDHFYLIPNTVFELAMLRIYDNKREEAEALLTKARSYKSYSLENKLHFRIHSAMEYLGSRTPIPQ